MKVHRQEASCKIQASGELGAHCPNHSTAPPFCIYSILLMVPHSTVYTLTQQDTIILVFYNGLPDDIP